MTLLKRVPNQGVESEQPEISVTSHVRTNLSGLVERAISRIARVRDLTWVPPAYDMPKWLPSLRVITPISSSQLSRYLAVQEVVHLHFFDVP